MGTRLVNVSIKVDGIKYYCRVPASYIGNVMRAVISKHGPFIKWSVEVTPTDDIDVKPCLSIDHMTDPRRWRMEAIQVSSALDIVKYITKGGN